ncbi:MAG TPA: ABC transporter substrate-binding protein [Longilinea sp.]|nr:ABC transporter substrate-binding protein [Longilinea sp.]
MSKKIFWVALIVMMLSLAACGTAATTTAPTEMPPAATDTSAPAATMAPTEAATAAAAATATSEPTITPAANAIQIQFWHGQSGFQGQVLNNLVNQFNETHPDIFVTATFQGTYSDLYKKVTAAIAGGTPPDLAVAYQNDVANYIASDAVIPLDSLMNDPQIGFSSADMQDIYPAFIDHYPQANNQVYSLAFMRSMEVMYYNNDMLKAAGITQPPATWDDFMTACAAVSKAPDTYCYEMNTDASRFANWVWSRGGDMLNADGKTVAFNSQAGLDTLNFLSQLFQKQYAIVIAKAYQDQTDFSLGKIAFAFGSTAGLPYYKTAIDQAGVVKDWGIAPGPHTTANPVVDAYGPSVTIFKTTTEKERAAFTFLKWLMDTGPNSTWVEATSYFPARQSTKASMTDFINTHPLYGQAFDWLQYGKQEPTVAAWNPIRGFLADALTAIANNTATPQDALNTAEQKANAALAGQ